MPHFSNQNMTVWPSGLRRWLQAPVRKGVGSNPTAVTSYHRPDLYDLCIQNVRKAFDPKVLTTDQTPNPKL